MAKCSFCGSTIVVGGVKAGDLRFCNDKCHFQGKLIPALEKIPPDLLDRQVQAVHKGPCPKCRGNGPVDVHVSHRAMSFFVMTTWKSTPEMSCRKCSAKRRLGDTALTLLLGWWGFPWGLIMTPVQISRNLYGIATAKDSDVPSAKLKTMVGLNIAKQIVETEARKAPASTP